MEFGVVPLGFQDIPLIGPAAQSGLAAVAGVLVALVVIPLWNQWRKGRAEDRVSTISEIKNLYDMQTANLAVANDKVSKLTDQLTTAKIESGDLRAENKYLREELEQTRAELQTTRDGRRPAGGQ
jgi:cell shape-determining protein MreC